MDTKRGGRRARFSYDLYLQVEPEIVVELDQLAEANGTSRAHEIRGAIRQHLAANAPTGADAEFLADIQSRTQAGA